MKRTGIRKRGNSYQARLRGPDGKFVTKTFASLSDAVAWRNATLTDIHRGDWVDRRRAKMTFEEVAAKWVATWRGLRPTTVNQKGIILDNVLLPEFGPRAIGSIRFGDIESFIADLEARELAPATITKRLQVLSQVFKYAMKDEIVSTNPVQLVNGPGVRATKETVYLTPAEVIRLSDAIDPRYRAMALMAGFRGPRWGELAGLKVTRLNLLAARMDVAEVLVEVRGQFSFGDPKTKESRRTIKLPRFLIEAFEDHLAAYPPTELVFTNPDGSPLRRSNFARRILKPAIQKAGLDPKLTFHGLRHTAVSILMAEGVQLPEVAAILGWSKSSMAAMYARYGHLYQTRDDTITDRLDELYRQAREASA